MSIGKMRDGCFEFETRCSICGRQRNNGRHDKCSKERQRRARADQEKKP